jgi:hypothetical protein
MSVNSRASVWFIAGALGASAIAGGVAVAASGSSTIHACEAKSTGALRVAKHCTKHEKAITWSSRGPAGKRGKAGKAGALNGFANGPSISSTSLTGNSTHQTVVAVTVSAPGNYIVTASTTISSTASTGALGTCLVSGGSASSAGVAWEAPGTSNLIEMYPTLTTEINVPTANSTLSYQCSSSANVTAETASISAVEVANAPTTQ